MLPTHQLVRTHKGYEIYQRQPGFEFTPVTMAKIASFIVQHEDGSWTVFAFMYSMLSKIANPYIEEDSLLDGAAGLIQEYIDGGDLGHRAELTFEYRHGRYVQVFAPRWWIPTAM